MHSFPTNAWGQGPGRNTGSPIWHWTQITPTPSNVAALAFNAETYDMLIMVNMSGNRNQWCDQVGSFLIYNPGKYETNVRHFTKISDGGLLSTADYNTVLAAFLGTAPFTKRRFIAYTVDEPNIATFNGSISRVQQNEMGLLYKSLFPGGCLTAQRSTGDILNPAPAGGWTGLDYGWVQFNRGDALAGSGASAATRRAMYAAEKAKLLALNLGMVPALNWINGGTGDSGIPGDLDTPSKRYWVSSPQELRDTADALYDDADAPCVPMWIYAGQVVADSFISIETRADYVAAFDYMLTKFATRPSFAGFRTPKGVTPPPPPPTSNDIALIGSASAAATSIVIPAHQAGDLIMMAAFGTDTSNTIGLPSGWTLINGSKVNVQLRGAYRVAVDGATVSGVWGHATGLICTVYRGVDPAGPIGDDTIATGTATATVQYQDLTMQVGDGTGWVWAAGVHTTATNVNSPPVGLTNRAAVGIGAVHDSNGGVASWADVNKVLNASGSWRALSVELKCDPAATPLPTNGAPVLEAIPPKQVEEDTTLTFFVTASDPEGDTIAYSMLAGVTAVPSGATLNSVTGAFAFTPTHAQIGTYQFYIIATDTTGVNPSNPTDTKLVTIEVTETDTAPPDPTPTPAIIPGALTIVA